MSVFVASKEMEYLLPCYHFQDPMLTTPLNPPFFIDARRGGSMTIRLMRLLLGFLPCHSVSVDAPNYRPHIVDFYTWWTQPMPSYYHFAMHVPEVVIPSESYSSPMDDTMSSARYDSSSKDIDATSFAPMSP